MSGRWAEKGGKGLHGLSGLLTERHGHRDPVLAVVRAIQHGCAASDDDKESHRDHLCKCSLHCC